MNESSSMEQAHFLIKEAQQIILSGNKIAYIKLIRGITHTGLRESKEMAENVIMTHIRRLVEKARNRHVMELSEIDKYAKTLRVEQHSELEELVLSMYQQIKKDEEKEERNENH